MNLLVVDPEAEVRLLFFSASDEVGGEVYFAETDAEAVQILIDETSIGMALIAHSRGTDMGLNLAKRIRSDFSARHIPILFLSDESDTRVLVQLLEYGDDVVIKPFSQTVLLAKLLAHRRTRELYAQIETQLAQLERHRAQVDMEHQIAADVFSRVLTRALPNTPGICTFVSPYSSFNGDMALVVARPGEGFHVLIADITGHGLPAALGTMPVADKFIAMTRDGLGISDIARAINSEFRQRMPDYLLCAATLISVMDHGRRLQVWGGGMPALLVLDERGHCKIKLNSQHMALGALRDSKFDDALETLYLERGDRVLCYTDGVTETANAAGEMFGEERLLAVVEGSAKRGQALVDHLVQSLFDYAGGVWLNDDATVFCFDSAEYRGLSIGSEQAEVDAYAGWDGFVWRYEMAFSAEQLREKSPLDLILSHFPANPYILAARADLSVIINELFVNALDHGILQLDSSLKEGAGGMRTYFRAREEKLKALDSGSIELSLQCRVQNRSAEFELILRDSGDGFDSKTILNRPEDSARFSGRGLRMIAAMCEEIAADETGKNLRVRYRWTPST